EAAIAAERNRKGANAASRRNVAAGRSVNENLMETKMPTVQRIAAIQSQSATVSGFKKYRSSVSNKNQKTIFHKAYALSTQAGRPKPTHQEANGRRIRRARYSTTSQADTRFRSRNDGSMAI